MTAIGPLDHEFTATLEGDIGPAGSWCTITWPGSKEFFGTGRSVKVVATIDGVEVTSAFMPNGDGMHLLPVKKSVRDAIRKGPGDVVSIRLIERLS